MMALAPVHAYMGKYAGDKTVKGTLRFTGNKPGDDRREKYYGVSLAEGTQVRLAVIMDSALPRRPWSSNPNSPDSTGSSFSVWGNMRLPLLGSRVLQLQVFQCAFMVPPLIIIGNSVYQNDIHRSLLLCVTRIM
jgi:hypothetical protein